MARRRFFVTAVRNGRADIVGEQAHHLTRVLRVEPGQKFEISDNQAVYLAEVETARKDYVLFAVLEQLKVPTPVVRTILLASLIKFDRFELMIEKTTELGVERLIPVEAERTEKGLAQAAHKRLDRWHRIGQEASEQSRRARLPDIGLPVDLAEAIKAEADYHYLLDEAADAPLLSVLPSTRQGDRVALLLGPEGGWTDREREAITRAGWVPVSLGEQILRAETTAIAAIAIVNAAWAQDNIVSH